MPEREELRERAVRQLKKKSDFRIHLLIYLMVNAFLVVIWAMTNAGFFWPVIPILGWGIGVVANAWDAYGGGDSPTESQINREIERMSKRR
jgi:uncharacterized ion transporter superfamily protein YfcC